MKTIWVRLSIWERERLKLSSRVKFFYLNFHRRKSRVGSFTQNPDVSLTLFESLMIITRESISLASFKCALWHSKEVYFAINLTTRKLFLFCLFPITHVVISWNAAQGHGAARAKIAAFFFVFTSIHAKRVSLHFTIRLIRKAKKDGKKTKFNCITFLRVCWSEKNSERGIFFGVSGITNKHLWFARARVKIACREAEREKRGDWNWKTCRWGRDGGLEGRLDVSKLIYNGIFRFSTRNLWAVEVKSGRVRSGKSWNMRNVPAFTP